MVIHCNICLTYFSVTIFKTASPLVFAHLGFGTQIFSGPLDFSGRDQKILKTLVYHRPDLVILKLLVFYILDMLDII